MQPAAPTLNSADSTAANQGAKGRTAKASVPVPSVRFQPQQEDTAIQTCRDVAVDTRFFTPIGANAFYVGFPSQGKGGHVVSGPQHAAVQQQAWERAELAAREEAVQDIKFEMKIEEDMQRRREDGRRYWQQRREQQEAYRVELEAQRQEKLQQLQERVWRQIEEADEDRAATSLAIGGGQGAARQARSAQGPNAAPWPAAPTRQQAPVQYKLRGAGGQQLSAEELMAALLEERQAEQEMVASYLKAQALAEERRQDDLADAQRRAAYRLAGRRY